VIGKSIKQMGPMAILKRTGSVLFPGAATAGVIGLSAAPAVAATWTVKPGGPVAATSGKTNPHRHQQPRRAVLRILQRQRLRQPHP
jgi:hypothetical protein